MGVEKNEKSPDIAQLFVILVVILNGSLSLMVRQRSEKPLVVRNHVWVQTPRLPDLYQEPQNTEALFFYGFSIIGELIKIKS